MDFDDPLWAGLEGGYGVPYDPRPALQTLEHERHTSSAWNELWNELHHQGDVGVASYAAVSHLVRIHASRGLADWNTYALVETIDEARRDARNPPLPDFLRVEYEGALSQLALLGLQELRDAKDPELVSSIIAVLATWKGLFVLGRLAGSFTEDELQEFITRVGF